MGFFSHLKPSLKTVKEDAEKIKQNTDEEINIEDDTEKSSVFEQPFTHIDRELIDGVDIVGLNSQMKQADEIIHNVRLSNMSQG